MLRDKRADATLYKQTASHKLIGCRLFSLYITTLMLCYHNMHSFTYSLVSYNHLCIVWCKANYIIVYHSVT